MKEHLDGPLSGLRVVELAGIGPAPYCAMLLADLGADVVRIERPTGDRDDAHAVLLRGRTITTLDLKDPADVRLLIELARHGDVLIEGFRPGVAERLGFGPDRCQARNPGLIYARITGWGQDGPWSSMAGHDINYIALAGVLNAFGRAGGPPVPPANLLGDFAGGSMFLLVGILVALYERRRFGLGQVIDASIVDGAASLSSFLHGLRAEGFGRGERGTNLLDTGAPFYDVYETADSKWLAIGALEPKFFAQLMLRLELPTPARQYDRAAWPKLRAAIADRVRTRSRDEWTQIFTGTDCCVAPVLSFDEVMQHEHTAARKVLLETDGIVHPAPAPRFSRTPCTAAGPSNREPTHISDVIRRWQPQHSQS